VYKVINDTYTHLHSVNLTDELVVSQIVFDLTDITGFYVNATNPVNIFSHVTCGHVPNATNFCGYLVEPIPPVSELGTTHVVPPLVRSSPAAGYVVRVVATSSETNVTWRSNSAVKPSVGFSIKSAGEFQQLDVVANLEPLLVTCSKPCLVMQYNKGRYDST